MARSAQKPGGCLHRLIYRLIYWLIWDRAIGDRLAMALVQPPARALALVIGALALGCESSGAPGGFEDDLGAESDPLPPDLPHAECDPRRFDDCGPGQKCSHVADTAFGPTNRCVELLGDAAAGASCERIGDSDTCANHLICWAADTDGLNGVCTPFCSPGLVCGGAGEVCSVATGGLLSLCLAKCDPFFQDCPVGWGCYADDYGVWTCDKDQSGDAGARGDACECLNCCDPGLTCVAGAQVDAEGCGVGGAVGCCTEICDLDDESPPELVCPTEAERCRAFYDSDAVLMGYERVGLCEL
ncbi:hypothetical protein [Enhygromyxa salina]|uniref:Uncharacterized protein n=1 Tax=Enhygromyxa salina TaxID=215803 RepID=A0A2S9Y3M7_9BACT|nr:hypothetical protein [Enhygromyxa salina]PRP99671.1 hypothetical protein ENSA7_63110 [Enhygromyxa salina]